MKPYILSLAVGLLVGIAYNLLDVRSPPPPLVALVGLLGILIGEQVPPVVKVWLRREEATNAVLTQVPPHGSDSLPTAGSPKDPPPPAPPPNQDG